MRKFDKRHLFKLTEIQCMIMCYFFLYISNLSKYCLHKYFVFLALSLSLFHTPNGVMNWRFLSKKCPIAFKVKICHRKIITMRFNEICSHRNYWSECWSIESIPKWKSITCGSIFITSDFEWSNQLNCLPIFIRIRFFFALYLSQFLHKVFF